jgi:hypothetical protein
MNGVRAHRKGAQARVSMKHGHGNLESGNSPLNPAMMCHEHRSQALWNASSPEQRTNAHKYSDETFQGSQ